MKEKGAYFEEKITYFETIGRENTEETLRLVAERARARGITKIVLASTTGDTARLAAERFADTGIKMVVIPHQYGFIGEQKFPMVLVSELEQKGHRVHFGTMLFHTDGFYGMTTPSVMATLLRTLCQGMKVCVEIILMATFTEEQARLFLEAVAESPYHELFTVALYTGMRRSELLGLPWKDVDLYLAQLSVTQTLHRLSSGGFIFGKPKTAKRRRTIALPPTVCILLGQLKERQIGERLLLGLKLQDDDLVFSKPDGKPLDPSIITRTFRKIIKRAGLPSLRFHDLRHTHASLMLKQGIHPKIVSERLGHSSIGITLDTYSHVMPGLQEAAALRFEEGLQQSSELSASEMLANG